MILNSVKLKWLQNRDHRLSLLSMTNDLDGSFLLISRVGFCVTELFRLTLRIVDLGKVTKITGFQYDWESSYKLLLELH